MEKMNLDWKHLPFDYMPTKARYVSNYKDGAWDEGTMSGDSNVTINESAGILQYCQEVFEGMKAYTQKDGSIVTFRPDLNAKRIQDSARRMEMPAFPEDQFLKAVDEVVKANVEYVPPYGTGASFYIRPYEFATGPVLGVKPAAMYQFRMFGSPVGPYFKNGMHSISITVSDFDRAAPQGTGHIKAGLNYAMSLHAAMVAHANGYDENMFLDAKERKYVEETGGANFIFVTKEGTLVTPQSSTILPSITRRSIVAVAKEILHIPCEERKVSIDELSSFVECGVCGTAAVISPVGKLNDHGKSIVFEGTKEGMGPVLGKFYEELTGIQMGDKPAPEGWIRTILPANK